MTTNYPDFFPVQRYAKRESVRRRLYQLYLNRGYPANDANLKRLLETRRTYATTLGFATWADYDAAEKMTKRAERIETFIGQLNGIVRPRNDADLEVLLARKRKDDPKAEAVEVWDRFFYVDRVRAEQFAFDAQSVRPYFAFETVTAGLMDLYGELFGVRFERDATAPVWHPSVLAYRLYSGDKLIGRFFLDMHPRAGKYGHAAMFPIQTGTSDGQLAMASPRLQLPGPEQAVAGADGAPTGGHVLSRVRPSRAPPAGQRESVRDPGRHLDRVGLRGGPVPVARRVGVVTEGAGPIREACRDEAIHPRRAR